MKYPPCFDSLDDYNQWRELAALDPSLALLVFPHCADCTPKYSLFMRALNRCENTNIAFIEICNEDLEPETVGVSLL